MPFTLIKRGKKRGDYKSPSGKVFTKRQVNAYYWTGGFKNKSRVARLKRI